MSVTEFINTIDVVQGNTRYIPRIAYKPCHRPLSLQLLDDNPERLLEVAIQMADDIQPDIIDINLGCQSKNVTARGAGAALLKTPEKIGRIFRLMTQHFQIPITGKIRLGWDGTTLNYMTVAKTIEDNGGSMIAVHGRTRRQGYKGHARWEPIAEIKQALSIPVVGNGDVRSVADIQKIQEMTGCDAVMIGRAAVGNPWIFSCRDREEVPPTEVCDLAIDHLEKMLQFFGPRGLIKFRKFLKAYLAPYQLPRERLLPFMTSEDPAFLIQAIRNLLNNMPQ